MRIVEPLTKQHPKTSLTTNVGTMQSTETYEATISCKEEVGIRTGQTREGVERGAVHGDEDRRGETRLQEEFNPMYIVVIRHVH
jgi:hypothetical protein